MGEIQISVAHRWAITENCADATLMLRVAGWLRDVPLSDTPCFVATYKRETADLVHP